jgi:hypothetical protein
MRFLVCWILAAFVVGFLLGLADYFRDMGVVTAACAFLAFTAAVGAGLAALFPPIKGDVDV